MKVRRRTWRWVLPLLAALPRLAIAQTGDAEDLFAAGRELRQQGRHEEALRTFAAAFRQSQDPRHLAYGAASELALRRYLLAEAHLGLATARSWGAPGSDLERERESFVRALAEVRGRLGWIDVRCPLTDAVVHVVPLDGEPTAAGHDYAEREGCGPVRTIAGTSLVTVTAPSRRRFEARVSVQALATSEVEVLLDVVQGVRIVGLPRGAHVELGGSVLNATDGVLALPAGTHEVRLSAEGYAPSTMVVTVPRDQIAEVRARMAMLPSRLAVAAPTPPVEPPPPPPSPPRSISPVTWVGFGVAAAGAGTAIALWVAGNDVAAQYRGDCRNGTPADADCWARYDDARAQLDRQAVQVNIAWGVAGAGLLTGGIALIASLASGGSAPSSPVQARVRLGSAALEVRW